MSAAPNDHAFSGAAAGRHRKKEFGGFVNTFHENLITLLCWKLGAHVSAGDVRLSNNSDYIKDKSARDRLCARLFDHETKSAPIAGSDLNFIDSILLFAEKIEEHNKTRRIVLALIQCEGERVSFHRSRLSIQIVGDGEPGIFRRHFNSDDRFITPYIDRALKACFSNLRGRSFIAVPARRGGGRRTRCYHFDRGISVDGP